jgi:sensor histidine kinase YesM
MSRKNSKLFLSRFLKEIPYNYIEDFHDNHLRSNLLKSIFIDRLCLVFFIPLMILDVLRWKNGDFEREPIYYLVAFSHFTLILSLIPYFKIIDKRDEIKSGIYPLEEVKKYLHLTLFIVIFSLLTINCYALYERNSLAVYGILLVLTNIVIVAYPVLLTIINIVLYLITVSFGLIFLDKNILQAVVFFLECSAFAIPMYVVSIFQYNKQIEAYIYERKLEEKNKIIEVSLTEKFERQIAEIEMTALRAQMNPHFIFNALNSIKLYVVSNEPKTAALYLTKFSKLIRSILNNSQSKLVSLEVELRALELYIQMEQFRFNFKFDYEIKVDVDVDKEFTEIPPILLQPYVENAIWHGLMHKHVGKGELCIHIKIKDGNLEFIIDDNGIGRAKSMELKTKTKTKHESIGMRITADRLAMANRLYGTDGKVTVIDKEDENGKSLGTKVIFFLPYEDKVG